jgi:hypothetical protein
MRATPQTLLGHATKTAALVLIAAASGLTMAGALAGPYSAALADPTNTFDAPVPGFVGPAGEGNAQILHPENYVNPLFFGWADGWENYLPAPGVTGSWQQPEQALAAITGDNFDIVSLGDLSGAQITNGDAPGSITMTFTVPIQNKTGADFVVFENSLVSAGGAGVINQVFGDLAYVEVSSDGVNFARMPSRSLTPAAVGSFGTIDANNVFGLAGKHANADGSSWGTPFDLAWLAGHPLVTGGQVNLGAVTHIRIVDIPGNGSFLDSTGAPIYDAWVTIGSGGLDLEAIGVIGRDMNFEIWQDQRGLAGHDRGAAADPDADGISNLHEYAAGLLPTSPDPTSRLQRSSVQSGRLTLKFCRDERATDLTLEVEASSNLRDWEVIARSLGGEPFQPVSPHAPQISESSAHPIASVGVLRQASIADVLAHAPRRFLRVSVKKTP